MADYSEQQLMAALRKADAAGDEAAARAIAKRVQAMRQPPAKTMEELTPGLSTNPTDGMSRLDLFRAGVGKSLVDTGQGLAQLVGAGPSRAEVDERRQLEGALMDTGAGVAGNIAGQVGQAFVPVGGAARLASYAGRAAPFVRAGIQGAALAGSQAVGEDDSRLANTALGGSLGIAGQGVASAAGGLARGMVSRLDEPTQALAAKAKEMGLRLGAGQITQNPLYRTVVSQMERLPFSGGGARAEANQAAFNRQVRHGGLPD